MGRERVTACDVDRLVSYRDGVLVEEERALVADHLARCGSCREELRELEAQRDEMVRSMVMLEPSAAQMPAAAPALSRLRAAARQGPPRRERRWESALLQVILSPMRRPAAAGVTLLAGMVVLLATFAPARQVAARFLSVFRVRQFAAVPVARERVSQLESIHHLIESGMLGERTILREPGPRETVADPAAASARAGYLIRVPGELPPGASLRAITVSPGPALRMEVDGTKAQAVLDAAGIRDVTLPAMGTTTVDVDVPMMVEQEYSLGIPDAGLSICQAPSPAVSLSSGADTSELGEAFLRILGVPAGDAHRLAETIDWTSTLVIPIPPDVGHFTELTVDGVRGLLLEQDSDSPSFRHEKVLVWQRDGMLYAVRGRNIANSEILKVADSLHR